MRDLNTEDIAALLGITPDAVRKLVQRGRIKATRNGPRTRIKYDPHSVYQECKRRGIELQEVNGDASSG